MEFNSLTYFVFLLATLGLFFALPRGARMLLLVAASLVSYGAWSVPFTGLIVVSAVVDFIAAGAIHRARAGLRRKLWLIASLTVNLGLLGVFKYAGFFRDSLSAAMGWPPAEALAITLPPEISFYTFAKLQFFELSINSLKFPKLHLWQLLNVVFLLNKDAVFGKSITFADNGAVRTKRTSRAGISVKYVLGRFFLSL